MVRGSAVPSLPRQRPPQSAQGGVRPAGADELVLAAASAEKFCAIRPVCLPVNGRCALRQENAQGWKRPVSRRGRRLRQAAHAEQLRQELALLPAKPVARHAEAVRPVPVASQPEPEPSAAQSQRPEPEAEQPPQPGPEAPQPAQPDWKPQTRLEHLSVELMNWFDDMMGA